MIHIDRLNIFLTIASIVVTLISIGFSIWAYRSAKKAEQYKSDVLKIKDSLTIEGLLSKFQTESKYFQNNTRDKNWYRGKDINSIISPFKDVLSAFGGSYHLISEPEILRTKVRQLDSIVNTYDKATSDQKSLVNTLIMEITEILQSESHSNTIMLVSMSK